MIDTAIPSQVRGIALIAIREYVQSRLGLRDAGEFFKRLSCETTHTVLNAQKVTWYPFAMESELRTEIVRWFNPDDPRKAILDLGTFTAKFEINASLKAMIGILPLRLLLKRSQFMWSRLYHPGHFKLRSSHETAAVFELTGFHSDPLFCTMVEAWLRTAGEILKLTNVEVSETACIHDGAGRCRWEISWQTAKTHPASPARQ
jgi:hypothetical protein